LLPPPSVRRYRRQSSCDRWHAVVAGRHDAISAALLSWYGRIPKSASADAGSPGLESLPDPVLVQDCAPVPIFAGNAGSPKLVVASTRDGHCRFFGGRLAGAAGIQRDTTGSSPWIPIRSHRRIWRLDRPALGNSKT